jgi:hypothetical protein
LQQKYRQNERADAKRKVKRNNYPAIPASHLMFDQRFHRIIL